MKKITAILITILMLFSFVGCNKNDDSNQLSNQVSSSQTNADKTSPESDTETSDSENSQQTTKGEETNTEENIAADVDTILDYLTKAEEIYNYTCDIIDDYNNDIITEEDTVSKFKVLEQNLNTLIEEIDNTEWKSEKYENNRSKQLDSTLNNLCIFFDSSEEAFSQRNNSLIARANAFLSSYASSSVSLYNEVKRDGK